MRPKLARQCASRIFSLFSDHYSEGGDSLQDKQNHYDSQIETARAGYDR